jgi:hypothetical protein
VHARNRETDELFLLPDGEADDLRDWSKKELRCPVRDCPSPELTTVIRTRGRDGFMHYTGGGGHDLESLFHLQACERIGVWLRANHPACTVNKDETTAARERRADVMITAPDGRKVAFEIQYAALTPAKWQERHDSYRAADIGDVWLFGHSGAQLRPARAAVARTGHGVARCGITGCRDPGGFAAPTASSAVYVALGRGFSCSRLWRSRRGFDRSGCD